MTSINLLHKVPSKDAKKRISVLIKEDLEKCGLKTAKLIWITRACFTFSASVGYYPTIIFKSKEEMNLYKLVGRFPNVEYAVKE